MTEHQWAKTPNDALLEALRDRNDIRRNTVLSNAEFCERCGTVRHLRWHDPTSDDYDSGPFTKAAGECATAPGPWSTAVANKLALRVE